VATASNDEAFMNIHEGSADHDQAYKTSIAIASSFVTI